MNLVLIGTRKSGTRKNAAHALEAQAQSAKLGVCVKELRVCLIKNSYILSVRDWRAFLIWLPRRSGESGQHRRSRSNTDAWSEKIES